jgi:hypothetical protein
MSSEVRRLSCIVIPHGITLLIPRRSRGKKKESRSTNLTSRLILAMQGPVKERWQILCEQAANEQDGAKLVELIKEINELLAAKQARLKANGKPATPGPKE